MILAINATDMIDQLTKGLPQAKCFFREIAIFLNHSTVTLASL